MRLRKKGNARLELEVCNFFVTTSTEYRGKWHSVFEKPQEIWLELGCGKGGFISKLASNRHDINFIVVDIKDEVLVLAKEKIVKEYATANTNTSNIRLMSHEIMLIHRMLNEHDTVNRIFINFCNPWYKKSHSTRRLTHPNQLNQYKTFLVPDGQIWFKTDDIPLFMDSIKYFEDCGFQIIFQTEDLHGEGFDENIETEHERFYSEKGSKINFLIAVKK